METQQTILDEIHRLNRLSGYKCGCTIVQLKNNLKFPMTELKRHLNKMHEEKQIIVNEGINSKLIFGIK